MVLFQPRFFHSLLDLPFTCLSNASQYFFPIVFFSALRVLLHVPLLHMILSPIFLYIYTFHNFPLLTEDDSSMSKMV